MTRYGIEPAGLGADIAGVVAPTSARRSTTRPAEPTPTEGIRASVGVMAQPHSMAFAPARAVELWTAGRNRFHLPDAPMRSLAPPSSLAAVEASPASPADLPTSIALAPQPPVTVPVSALGRTPSSKGLLIDGSAWLLVRNAGSGGLATAGELGGSQAGVRVNVAIAGPLFATARISTPLTHANGREASVGLGLRKGGFGVLLERRIAIDAGARNDISVTAYGGVSDVRLPGKLRLDAYGQAGIVGRDGFADGAASLTRSLVRFGKVDFAIGGGAWGGVQPGVRRLDIGPQLVLRVPVTNRSVLVSGAWRQRIAGNAAPASGPTLTIGVDF